MTELNPIIALMFFPGGIFVMLLGLLYVWINRKLRARL
ncbi:MAG: NADH-quinone oxidoreductase subunit H, partial [Chloroflexi bacterium]|nr:NADH-quinone oxidoreductase subunit H [Chloroflexota bacterium]